MNMIAQKENKNDIPSIGVDAMEILDYVALYVYSLIS